MPAGPSQNGRAALAYASAGEVVIADLDGDRDRLRHPRDVLRDAERDLFR